MTTRGFRIFGVGVALGTATACSTLAPPPQAKLCESNDDCEQGEEICALDVGICIRSQHVPRRHLGLDIREPPELATQRYAFRSEVHGCDREVVLRSTPDQEYRVRKSNLVDHLAIELFEDPSDPTSLVSADIELTTVSRLATVRTEAQLVHPTLDEEDNLLATEVDWPHYHPSEMFQAEGFEAGVQILLKAAPDDGARAPVYRFVATPATDTNRPCTSRAECCPPSGCPDVRDECMDVGDGARECSQGGNRPWRYTFRYTDLCNRITTGSVLRVNEDSVEIGKVESALVRFLHARPDSDDNRVTIPVAAGPLPELVCTTDSDCVAGSQLCVISDGEASGHCELDLAGLDATFGSIETDPVGGFAAPLYSYCEGQASGDLTRSFTVSVQPPPEEADAPTVVPSGTFEFDQKFIPATEDSKPPTFLEGSLCLPDWGASTELDVRLQAAPAPVWGQGSDEWRCCDTSCLVGAVSEDEPIPTPPDPPLTCAGLSSSGPPLVTAEAGWSPADDAAWAATGCQPVKLDSRGHAGYLRRKGVCDEEGSSCLISRLGAGPSGAARPYTIRIEPPPVRCSLPRF